MEKVTSVTDLEINQILSFTLAPYVEKSDYRKRFRLKTFYVSSELRKSAFEGHVEYIPVRYFFIPSLFRKKQIKIDVALVQVSPPDEFGFCSLGISVDICKAAVENADLVIAQVNKNMPRTMGDSFIPVSKINYLVPYDEPLIQFVLPPPSEVACRIGRHISNLIEDGATLHVGIGRVPQSVLYFLKNKKDLGLHTEIFTDGMCELIKAGIITNEKKNFHPGKVIATFCMGSENLYRFVHNNPMIEFHPADYVNNPMNIAQNKKMVSIDTALEIDLTGQVCSDSLGYKFFSGIGSQVDFIQGATLSEGGLPIIALPATAKEGAISRIVPHLSEGSGVVCTRGSAHYVVTEFGVAYLHGREIRQRVLELISIAHPKFREELLQKAKMHHYVFPDQLPLPSIDLQFLEKYEKWVTIKNEKKLFFRPIRSTDEMLWRDFLYSTSEESIYYRFFQAIMAWPHEEAQKWVNIDYKKTMAIVGLTKERGYEEIVAIGRYINLDTTRAEVDFLIREGWQKLGIGKFLLEYLAQIAKENGYKEFIASALSENIAMINVFKKVYPNLKMSREGNVVYLYFEI
jgi:acyl-CoA hydrolase/GNAT superfamily N-acetyltransferase